MRSLYYWLRIYLNLIVAKALNPNDILASAYLADRGGLLYDNCFKNLIDLKKIFSGLIFYKKIQFLRYGVIFRFSNYSSYKTFYILLQQSLYHLKSLVLKSKFLNIFLRNTFGNNLFFVGANQLNYLVSWLKSVIFKKSYVVTFYPIFYRLGCNWVKENFFINFINNFRNKLSQTYLLLKILFSQFFIKLTKYIYTLVSRVLKILYANISSINSLSKI